MLWTEWSFVLESAVQRFLCETADYELASVEAAAEHLCVAMPDAPSFTASGYLRATLIELSLRWGYACHDAARARCLTRGCLPSTLTSLARYWSPSWQDRDPGASCPKQIFVTWLQAFCPEMQRPHPESLA